MFWNVPLLLFDDPMADDHINRIREIVRNDPAQEIKIVAFQESTSE